MPELELAAAKVAEKAVDAWRSSSVYRSNIGVPLGVVAGLTLMDHWSEQDSAAFINQCSDEEIADALMTTWSMFTIIRPELAFRLGIFGEWLNDEPREPHVLSAAAAVARAAAKHGLFDISSDVNHLRSVDLLGQMHQSLTGLRDKQARGEFYTPPGVADLMAGIVVGEPQPGQSVSDCCSGTGGLLRSAAERMRRSGGDPHDCSWWACDIDPLAIAALAVNFQLWDLGPNVVVGCANIITEGDWHVRAIREQLQAIEAQQQRERLAQLLAVTQDIGDEKSS
jgi:hypothetical protein